MYSIHHDRNTQESCVQVTFGKSERLASIAEKCAGLSGRTLRKLPFLAMVKAGCYCVGGGGCGAPLPANDFFAALDGAVDEELTDRKKLDGHK